MLMQGSLSQTSDFCLFQHQITSNFYPTVLSKLNPSINKPNKTRLPSLNPNESEISPLHGEGVYNLRKMLISTQRRELLWFETITKHTSGWEIDERNLINHESNLFSSQNERNVENKKKTTQSDLSTKHQTSEIPYLFEYNARNFIPKTPTQSSVRVINEVLDFYAFTPEGTWVQARILNKSYARERASTVYFV